MSYTRTARRAHQRKATPPRKPALNPGKRDPRPFVGSMLTTVDWPVKLIGFAGQAYTDGGYAARKEAWLVNFLAERASFGHAPNRERWMPKMVTGAPVVMPQAA